MLDIRLIRDQIETVRKGLAAKNAKVELKSVLDQDKKRRALLLKLEGFRSLKNQANDEIGKLIKEKKDPKKKISSMKSIAKKIDDIEPMVKDLESKINEGLLGVPNLPHASTPVGGESQNEIVRSWGKVPKLAFKPKTHTELGEDLDIIDLKRAAKIAGSHFILFKGAGALMERALINFMLDMHTREHDYTEIFPPFLVNRAAMIGTGQLPKMEQDMYRLKDDDLFLIPTAEVPVTNIYRDEIISEEKLPVKFTAYTACFRREAGSYGKDTKGMIRVHQFDKVELVKFVKPETSYDELESLVGDAEEVLQKLELPYRVILLASGELSFASSKCFDIEVYALGVDQWLEVSSCSNFEDFQARRANIRFKGKTTTKPAFVHTLNGSGLALARIVIALIENYQEEDGSIVIPKVLQPYMGGLKKITNS